MRVASLEVALQNMKREMELNSELAMLELQKQLEQAKAKHRVLSDLENSGSDERIGGELVPHDWTAMGARELGLHGGRSAAGQGGY